MMLRLCAFGKYYDNFTPENRTSLNRVDNVILDALVAGFSNISVFIDQEYNATDSLCFQRLFNNQSDITMTIWHFEDINQSKLSQGPVLLSNYAAFLTAYNNSIIESKTD